MAKIIDLDALLPEEQFIRLDGKDHPINIASVQMYLEILKKRDKLSRTQKSDSEYEQTLQAIELIEMAVPTLTHERLVRLPLAALLVLTQAIEAQVTTQSEAAGGANASGE